jgi:L-rhamnose mutarotase
MGKQVKRHCKTLQLKDDTQLIESYKKAHAPDATLPGIAQEMKEAGKRTRL